LIFQYKNNLSLAKSYLLEGTGPKNICLYTVEARAEYPESFGWHASQLYPSQKYCH
jgi:hypothetical protein